MKYGKEYERLLRESSFPPEWIASAIEYGQLKKLIKNVVDELQSIGLNPDVLHELLDRPASRSNSPARGNSPARKGPSRRSSSLARGSSPARGTSGFSASKGKARLSDSEQPGSKDDTAVQTPDRPPAPRRRRSEASYKIEGSSSDFISRLRLKLRTLPRTSAPAKTASELKGEENGLHSEQTGLSSAVTESESDDAQQGDDHDVALLSSSVQYHSGANPIWALQRGSGDLGTVEASLRRIESRDSEEGGVSSTDGAPDASPSDQAALIPLSASKLPVSIDDTRPGEVVIDLPSDTLFFKMFSQALGSLDQLAVVLKEQFTNEVLQLSRAIGDIARPTGKRKSDLAAWREIFSLWIEADIFENNSERNRGERSVEETEIRLKAFAAELVKRRLEGRKMHSKQSRQALERFMKLNVSLLDLKKFQLANAEAARKILKKHDKRTALKGTSEYSALVRSSNMSSQQASTLLSLWAAHTTLPHILLATLTEKLLPIVPQIDDYMCAICTSIAYKPIRLDCSHMFCVRCLVKMQKRGQADCPLCRAPTVLQANRANVDWALLRFMQEWFPEETKQKNSANEKEAGKEELEALGFNEKCTIM